MVRGDQRTLTFRRHLADARRQPGTRGKQGWTERSPQCRVDGPREDALARAAPILDRQSEAAHPDFQAARRAHDELGFYLSVLERLAGSVPGALLVGEDA